MSLHHERLYIGGEWVKPASSKRFEVVDASTEEAIGSTPEGVEADIDRAKVVWARDMGGAQNRELFCYYKDRRWWLMDADASRPRLVPYAGEASIKATGAESDVASSSGENPCS